MTLPTSDEEYLAFNREVIDEFRSSGGRVARHSYALLLLTTIGARSGRSLTSPLTFGVDGGRVYIIASKSGAASDPAWLHNVRANPNVTVEIGPNTYRARATIVDDDERDRLFEVIARVAPRLVEFKAKSTRPFPIVLLDGVTLPGPNDSTKARISDV